MKAGVKRMALGYITMTPVIGNHIFWPLIRENDNPKQSGNEMRHCIGYILHATPRESNFKND